MAECELSARRGGYALASPEVGPACQSDGEGKRRGGQVGTRNSGADRSAEPATRYTQAVSDNPGSL
jgi:hypothetical protein